MSNVYEKNIYLDNQIVFLSPPVNMAHYIGSFPLNPPCILGDSCSLEAGAERLCEQ